MGWDLFLFSTCPLGGKSITNVHKVFMFCFGQHCDHLHLYLRQSCNFAVRLYFLTTRVVTSGHYFLIAVVAGKCNLFVSFSSITFQYSLDSDPIAKSMNYIYIAYSAFVVFGEHRRASVKRSRQGQKTMFPSVYGQRRRNTLCRCNRRC